MWFRCKNLVEGKVLAVLLSQLVVDLSVSYFCANLGCHIGHYINSYFHIGVYLCGKS